MATPGDTSDANQQPQPQPQQQSQHHQPPGLGYDEKSIRAFFKLICDPAVGCTELRIFKADVRNRPERIVRFDKFNKTIAGWFDKIEYFFPTVAHIDGVSAYVTVNPVTRDLLGRATNRVRSIATGEGSKDADILCHRWLYIDIDPERPSGISATHEELVAAIAVRDRILSDHPLIAASAAWGCSGNGGWILVRLADLPATDDTYALIGSVLDRLASRYGRKGRDRVSVDQSTKNAARVMCLPGTLKAKGDPQPDRPWRMVTIDGFGGQARRGKAKGKGKEKDGWLSDLGEWKPEPWGIDNWLEENTAPAPDPAESNGQAHGHHLNGDAEAITAARGPGRSKGQGRPDDLERCRSVIFGPKFLDSVAGQDGHKKLYHVAAIIWNDFELGDSVGLALLREWNQLKAFPPESDTQIIHKWESVKKNKGRPSGVMRDQDSPEYLASKNGHHACESNGYGRGRDFVAALVGIPGGGGDADGLIDPNFACPPGQETNPHRLARLFLGHAHFHQDGYSLRFWRDEFHSWNGRAYGPIALKEIRGALSQFVSLEFDRIYQNQLIRYGMRKEAAKASANGGEGGGEGGGPGGKEASGIGREPKLLPVTTTVVMDTLQALSGLTLLPTKQFPSQPVWLDGAGGWAPEEILPAKNALIHLPSVVTGSPCMIAQTPRFFGSYALDYEFQPDAPNPDTWLAFLDNLWPNDPESIKCLQEWFGYLLSLDTRQQKILMMIGPKRSGKGTIARILKALACPSNVVNPTLGLLAKDFGLAPLIGKSIAIIPDARLSNRPDNAAIVEKLVSISGEDDQTIDRKHVSAWTGKLPTRFVLISNEIPKLRDASGALAGRLIVLQLTNSFYGREDKELESKLMPELPGILLWAIRGLARLRKRGEFFQPESALPTVNAMVELSSPITAFIAEMCMVEDGSYVPIPDLYNAWKTWNQVRGREKSGDEQTFGRDLHTAVPNLDIKRPRNQEGIRMRVYVGVRLKTPMELALDGDDDGDSWSAMSRTSRGPVADQSTRDEASDEVPF